MKRFKNIILGILAAGMLTVAAPVGGISAYASSAKISFSDPSATVGQEFSVNVKISSQDGNLGASDVVLSYDPSVIEFVSGNNASGGAGSVRLVGTMDSNSTKAFSYTLKFKAVQAGIRRSLWEVMKSMTQMHRQSQFLKRGRRASK